MESDVITELYKNQMSIIYKYLIKLGCSKHEADDIVQEAFVRAIQYMDGVKPEKLPSWLFTVAINIFRTNRRRSKKIYLSIDEEQYYNNFYCDDEVDDSLLSDEKVKFVQNTLEHLGEDYRTILLMKYQADLSYKQISTLLGMPENTVRTYLYRAREEFKERWMSNYEGR